MMISTLIFSVILVIGIAFWIIHVRSGEFNSPWEFPGLICSIIGGLGLLICILFIIMNPIKIQANINEFYAVKSTVQAARVNPELSEYETATLQFKIIECNQWLAKSQFWARNKLTNWFWPKKIFDLNPIK